jgi:TPR repeat protein
MYNLGMVHARLALMRGSVPDAHEAERWLLRAAERGDRDAMVRLAELYDHRGEAALASQWRARAQ